MQIKRINLCFYSPTGTTQKIVSAIAAGTGVDPLHIIENNLTFPEHEDTFIEIEPDDLVILGGPVYAGQIAREAHNRIEKIKFQGNPAVLVAVYGNRHYDDALIDLREMATRLGLKPIAAAAFIGEHSYSTRDFPIAKGRPDAEDRQSARDFGRQIAERLTELANLDNLSFLTLPGTDPLPPARQIGASHAETAPNKCIKCGICETVCPTGAVFFKKTYQTDAERCTVCCACVKACKRKARIIISEHIPVLREKLAAEFSERRSPEFFF